MTSRTDSPEFHAWLLAIAVPIIGLFFLPHLIFFWLIFVGWFIYKQFLATKLLDARGKAVFVTGCDSGFGLMIAEQLHSLGCTVFAGCLRPDGPGARQLRNLTSDRIKILDLDVTDKEKIENCANTIEQYCNENKGGLWALVNNAGIAMAGEVEFVPLDEYKRSMEVNCWGPVAVTKSVLPLIRNAKGRVITITSGIARCVQPGRSPYCMSKSALEAFCDCLRYEMQKFGVKVITITPGNLTGVTNIFDFLGRHFDETIVPNIPQRILRDYGRPYVDAFRSSIIGSSDGYRSQGSSLPAQLVINAIRDASLSDSPRVRYHPAQLTWPIWWFICGLLPADITDKCQTYWQRNLPKPASCQ